MVISLLYVKPKFDFFIQFDKLVKFANALPCPSEAFYDENCGSSVENTVLRALGFGMLRVEVEVLLSW